MNVNKSIYTASLIDFSCGLGHRITFLPQKAWATSAAFAASLLSQGAGKTRLLRRSPATLKINMFLQVARRQKAFEVKKLKLRLSRTKNDRASISMGTVSEMSSKLMALDP